MKLNHRHWGVACLVADGMKNREIAALMGTTEHMIKNYLCTIFDETGMFGRLELALWYMKDQYERN